MKFDPVERRAALWASEAPGALGVSPYSGDTPHRLWRIKTGRQEPESLDGVEAVNLGNEMQGAIGELLARRAGLVIRDAGDAKGTCAGEPWLRAHTDFFVEKDGERSLAEVKFYAPHKRDQFGEIGGDDVPLYAAIQCIHEACAFNMDTVWFGALFGNQAFGWWKLHFPEAVRLDYIRQAAAFWSHVVTDTPPPARHANDVLALSPTDNGTLVMAADRDMVTASRLRVVRAQLKKLGEQEAELANALKLAIGAASGLVSPAGHVLASWKAGKDVTRFDVDAFKEAMPDLYKQYTRKAPGSRRFLIKG